jgi:ADP-heptose:LPS heptosyltransferase
MRLPLKIDGKDLLASATRVLIVRLRSLGDCVLSTPAIHVLKQSRPKIEIGVVVEPEWEAVFEGNPDVSRILLPSFRSVWSFDPQVCIDFHGGNTAARLTLMSGAKYRAGFTHFKRLAAYNIRIPTAQWILNCTRKVHTAEHMASAMFHLGVESCEVPRAQLFATPAGIGRAPYAVIHPVAATPEKTWLPEGFLQVAGHLREHHGIDSVFIAGKDQDLSPFTGWQTISGARLNEIKSVIAGAGLFVGNDSGPAHIAAAFGVPPVVIFGPSDAGIWGPWGTRGEVVQADGPIGSVTAERVIEAVDHLRVCA